MQYEPVIGLEVHTQLKTRTKIFCGCSTAFGGPPNTHTCPVCLGMPGVLPVLNKKVVEYTLKMAIATHCRINRESRFARKNYFYPDLPKGYQISQYELPVALNGFIDIEINGNQKRIGITRIHMEEDAGKLIHDPDRPLSMVDFNRTGVPLIEIVSEPDIRSPEEAGAYLRHLRAIVRYLDISDGNMEEGSFRCDANVSVRPKGSEVFGIRTELKNLNSFKHVEKALSFEISRQIDVLEDGGQVIQETRLWDPDKNKSSSMRGKEEAHDYRYFPDRLPAYDADLLTSSRELADYFEACLTDFPNPKQVSNWVMGSLMGLLNAQNKSISESPISSKNLARLLLLIDDKTISSKIAKTVFDEMAGTGKTPKEIVTERGLVQMTDETAVKGIVKKVLGRNPTEVMDYQNGKTKLFGFFVGQVMKETKGKANPKLVNEKLTSNRMWPM